MLTTIAWTVAALFPLVALTWLSFFLIWLGKGHRENRLTRVIDRTLVPLGILTFGLLFGVLVLSL